MRCLDFFLISDTIQSSAHSCEMLNPLQSDHSPIKIKFKSLNAVKGKVTGNSTIHYTFVQNMKSKINETIPVINSYNDPGVGWEYLKYKMREYEREVAINNARKRKKSRVELEQKVLNLEMNMTENPSVEKKDGCNAAKLKLEKIYEYITDRIIMRSKCQWDEEGEKSTKYFLPLEKKIKSKHTSKNFVLMRRMKKQQIPNRFWMN